MKIAVVKESRFDEKRVAASPETVKKLTDMGQEVIVQSGAGVASAFIDKDYETAGAKITPDFKSTVTNAQIILKVQKPSIKEGTDRIDELQHIPSGATIIGILSALTDQTQLLTYNQHNLTSFSMDMIPRITRAQSMDVLSSQSNLAGYRAVIEAAGEYGRAFPMMMTAAGTVPPARVLILGAGVAGLQAIATAKRLGAIVSAFDVRPSVKEQVESLGATFVEIATPVDAEASSGYAKEMSKDYQAQQAEKIRETLAKSDIIITTALIPGKPAPVLITKEMVDVMKPGSIIVDMAVEMGGNCTVTKADEVINYNGIKIIGYRNLASRIPQDASRLYARNILSFLNLIINPESKELMINQEDEIIKGTLLTRNGRVMHDFFKAA